MAFGLHSGANAAREMGGTLTQPVRVPVREQHSVWNYQPQKQASTHENSLSHQPHRILIVDDNPSIHQDFNKILCPNKPQEESAFEDLQAKLLDVVAPESLTASAFEVDSAFQGQEALEKVRVAETEGRPYAMAFMDVRMPPGWDGIETTRIFGKSIRGMQVVICTAYSDYSWEEILRKLGESDSLVILKTFSTTWRCCNGLRADEEMDGHPAGECAVI